MKRFAILIIFLPLASLADEECALDLTPSALKEIIDIGVPNCATKKNRLALSKGDKKGFCSCKGDFTKRLPSSYSVKILNEKTLDKKKFFNLALDEYKKVISNTLVDITKLRASPSTGSDFKKSIAACNTSKTIPMQCKNVATDLSNSFKEFQGKLANELAHIIANPTKSKQIPDGLLSRKDRLGCSLETLNLTEQQALYLKDQAFEEFFIPDSLDAIKNMQGQFNTLTELLEKLPQEKNIDKLGIKSHPLFSAYEKNPMALIDLLKKVTPETPEALKAILYSPETGSQADARFADICNGAFEALIQNICNEDFEQGKIKGDSNIILAQLNSKYGDLPIDEKASTESLVDFNLELFSVCNMPETGADLAKAKQDIDADLQDTYSKLDLKAFSEKKYSYEFDTTIDLLCPQMDSKCSEKTLRCILSHNLESQKKLSSIDAKLAKSSDGAVNSLLRSLIGNPNNIQPETRTILVSQGILPKEDGKYVAQPKIPEREPNYFRKPASVSPYQTTSMTSDAGQNQTASTTTPDYSYAPAQTNFYANSQAAISNPNSQDNSADLSRINQEIARRLKASGTSTSKEDIKKVATDVLQDQTGQTPNQADVQNAVEDYAMAAQKNWDKLPVGAPMVGSGSAGTEISKDEAAKAAANAKTKRENLAALSGMASVQKTANIHSNDPVSANQIQNDDNKMNKDNLKNLEVLKLSVESLQKTKEGNVETQQLASLVKNKKDFKLQINNITFLVKFDKTTGSILINPEGTVQDPAQANKIMTQIRSFVYEASKPSMLKDLKNNFQTNI